MLTVLWNGSALVQKRGTGAGGGQRVSQEGELLSPLQSLKKVIYSLNTKKYKLWHGTCLGFTALPLLGRWKLTSLVQPKFYPQNGVRTMPRASQVLSECWQKCI